MGKVKQELRQLQALRLEARKLKRESEALDLVVDRSVSFLFSRSRSRLLCMRACAACVHVHVRARACVHACVCACGHACACVGDLEMDDRRPFHYDTPRVSPTSPGTVPHYFKPGSRSLVLAGADVASRVQAYLCGVCAHAFVRVI